MLHFEIYQNKKNIYMESIVVYFLCLLYMEWELYQMVSHTFVLNTYFQFLNKITCIFTHFFTHIYYFQKNWKLFFKHTYQTGLKYPNMKGSSQIKHSSATTKLLVIYIYMCVCVRARAYACVIWLTGRRGEFKTWMSLLKVLIKL